MDYDGPILDFVTGGIVCLSCLFFMSCTIWLFFTILSILASAEASRPRPIPGQRWFVRGVGTVGVMGVTPPERDNDCWEGRISVVFLSDGFTKQGAIIEMDYRSFLRNSKLLEEA